MDGVASWRRGHWAAAVALLGLAVYLRLHHLTYQSLWFDELFSVVFSHPDRTVADIVQTYAHDVHPLLFPLMVHLWLKLTATTELAARLLPALLGVAGVGAMLALGRRLADLETGVLAVLLLAVNAFHIEYSQEVRSYSLLVLLATLSYTALLALLDRPGVRTGLAYGLVSAIALHTHYYALIMVGSQLAAIAVVGVCAGGWRRLVRPIGVATLTMLVLYLPWLGPVLRAAGMREYWPKVPGPGFFARYFSAYFGEDPALTVLFAILLALLPVSLLRRTRAPTRTELSSRVAVLALALVLSVAVPYLRSVLVVPMLVDRFTIIVLPPLIALLALSVRLLPGARLRTTVAMGVLAVSLFSLFQRQGYYVTIDKEQWRHVAEHALADQPRRKGRVAYLSHLAPGFQFYFDAL